MGKFNIYHRQDGRWEGRIPKGKNENGSYRFKYVFAHSREAVEEKITKIYRQEQSDNCSKSVSEVFREWIQNNKHRIKESTLANYLMKAEKHILPKFGNNSVDSINDRDIIGFIDEKLASGLSNRYVSDIIVLMKSIFKYAVRVYHIFNPLNGISMPKKKKSEIDLLDDNEQQKLQQYIADNQNLTTLGIALSMSTGIRIGELCALQWKDIDLEKRILTVRKTIQRIQCKSIFAKTKLIITEPKSESSYREIPVPDCMMDLLKKFRSNDDDHILSGTKNPVEPRTMQYRFAKILKNANLPSVHFHSLRHIFASNCIKWGFDVKALSELLGHSSVEITLNLYVHSSFEQKRAYMKQVSMNF
ncbi:MAG: site-specific integrase [Clostridium sp.]|nr:site-specific integrase [Clostridium sp.]